MALFLSTHFGFFIAIVILFSLLIGSFLNVVIYRLPLMAKQEFREECLAFLDPAKASPGSAEKFNLSLPPSHCPICKKRITCWQNIPIISYFLLRGRCHFCQTIISFRYPLIEAATALLSVFIALRFGFSPACFWALIFTWFLIAISVIDFDHHLIFDSTSISLLWIGLILSCFNVFTNPIDAIFGAVFGYSFFWTVAYLFKIIRKKEGMGHGDFKLFAASGAWFGWQMLPMTALLSCCLALLISSPLLFLRKQSQQTPIPFGPFITAAMFVTILFGHDIMCWYMQLLFGGYPL
jgi:leader peptidase (prepilin peptidase)/N-methyltransferase